MKKNYQIKAEEVRLIGSGDFEQKVYPIKEARQLAEDLGLDLILVNENQNVCTIADYAKYMFDKKKTEKKPKVLGIKEIRVSVLTDSNDLKRQKNNARRFLELGYQVKFTVYIKGGGRTFGGFKIVALKMLRTTATEFKREAVATAPKLSGKRYSIILNKLK